MKASGTNKTYSTSFSSFSAGNSFGNNKSDFGKNISLVNICLNVEFNQDR